MKNKLLLAVLLLASVACSSSKNTVASQTQAVQLPRLASNNMFLITENSNNPSYGYKAKNPIKVGGIKESEGPLNERRFLNALTGPNGEEVSYYRSGSCCAFKTKNGFMGSGLLDIYEVTWQGSKDTLTLYLNMYDAGELKAPVGFKYRQQ